MQMQTLMISQRSKELSVILVKLWALVKIGLSRFKKHSRSKLTGNKSLRVSFEKKKSRVKKDTSKMDIYSTKNVT